MSSLSGASDDTLWRTLHKILDTIPTPHNRDVILRYLQERKANGMKAATLGVDANALRAFCVFLGQKEIEASTRADVIGYVNYAKNIRRWCNGRKDGSATVTEREERLSDSTLQKRKEIIKPFFRWLRGMEPYEGYPPEVKSLKSKKGGGDVIPADELVTKEDLRALIQASPDAQDKARLAVLYESGLRAGEFCALNVGSVVFDEFGAVLTLPKGAPGLKTGARRIRLFDSVAYLHAWYEANPKKEDPKAPLFHSNGRRCPGIRLSNGALWVFCKRTTKKAGIKKHVHPHLFRHSAATERARLGWNEGQMRAFFGWAKDSDMPSVYVHLAGMDYENVEIERRGLRGKDEVAGPALRPLKCRQCGLENVPTTLFCTGCRKPVSPDAEAALDRKKQEEIKDAVGAMLGNLLPKEFAAFLEKDKSRPEA